MASQLFGRLNPKPTLGVLILLSSVFVVGLQGCGDGSTGPSDQDDPGGDPTGPDPWLVANTQPIFSLTSSDFSDLQFLKTAIGDRRIVQLGESGHGIAEFNMAKVRLIQFLHQEMGFEVMAFESSIYDCFRANRLATEFTSGLTMMYNSIYGVWHTYEVEPLFDYILDSQDDPTPLILAGFDMKPSSASGPRARPAFMTDVVEQLDPAYAQDVETWETDLMEIMTGTDWRVALPAEASTYRIIYEGMVDFFDDHEAESRVVFAADPEAPLMARQTAWTTINRIDYANANTSDDQCAGTEARDFGMATNLTFLADELYPDKKIIVWAHNFHIRHDNGATTEVSGPGCTTMGRDVAARHRDDLYTVGLYMAEGWGAWNDRRRYIIQPPDPGTLEYHLNSVGEPYLFLDLLNMNTSSAPSWITSNTYARSWGIYEVQMVPRDQYDGILFIQEVDSPAYTY